MVVLRFLLKVFYVIVAALAGNWVGGQVRIHLTGQEVQSIRFQYTNKQGKMISNIPVVTKFYPAVITAGIGRPHWRYAFLGGAVAGMLIDDRYERYLWERVGEKVPTREMVEGIAPRSAEQEVSDPASA